MLVNNKGNYSYHANGLTLIPGTNKVDDKDFEKFISHPLMAHLDQHGEFVYDKEKTKPSAKDVVAMVEDTFDIDMLVSLKAEDDRKTVQDAIDKRIEELKNPKE